MWRRSDSSAAWEALGVGVGFGVGGTATGVPLTSTSETSMNGRGASWLSETGATAVRRISRRPARSPLSGSVTYPRASAAPTVPAPICSYGSPGPSLAAST